MQKANAMEIRKYILIRRNPKECQILTLKEIEQKIAFMDVDELSEYVVCGPVQENTVQLFEMIVEPGYVGLRDANHEVVEEYTENGKRTEMQSET